MDALTAIRERRAVKHFDPNHGMAKEEIERLMSLVMLSPSAFNIQHWRFVLVRDPELRKKIREAAWGQAQVTDASLLVILCGDLKAWEKDPGRYWRDAPPEIRDQVVDGIRKYYQGNERVQRDEVIRSCGIAAQTLMLAAKAMGYDTCPMDGFDFEAVAKLINLPEDHIIAMFVAVGKGVKEARPRMGKISMEEAVIRDHF